MTSAVRIAVETIDAETAVGTTVTNTSADVEAGGADVAVAVVADVTATKTESAVTVTRTEVAAGGSESSVPRPLASLRAWGARSS